MSIFKEQIYDEKTNTYINIDERVFEMCVIFAIKEIKTRAKDLILEIAPEYKQRNAALGLLSIEETNQIKYDIQSIRSISNQKELEILQIIWNGQESTRIIACDAIQNIRWD